MRTIKFRAWDKRFKQMVNSKCCVIADGKLVVNKQQTYNEFPDKINLMNNNYFQPSDEFEIMQYAGLKDKKGVEIYEGDIIKLITYKKECDEEGCEEVIDEEFIGKIEFNKTTMKTNVCGFILSTNTKLYDHLLFPDYELEVIGNIYENPELLEVVDASTK